MKLFVFSSARKIREFIKNSNDFFIPKIINIDEFYKKSLYVEGKNSADEISKILLMREAVLKTKEDMASFKFPTEFFEFMKNSDYLFSFFKELSKERVAIKDIEFSDIYAGYDEHLSILSILLKNYKEILGGKNLYDEITLPDFYEINTSFIANFDEIDFYIDGFLSRFDFEILSEISKITELNLIFKSTALNQKLSKNIASIVGEELEVDKIYRVNLTKNLIESSEILKKNNEILTRSFGLRSLQAGYVFEKISTFIRAGVKPEEIVVILPDESFSEILKSYDSKNMLNFAMGTSFKRTKFFEILSEILLLLKEKISPNFYENEPEFYDIHSLFLHENGISWELFSQFASKFDVAVSFDDFLYLIDEILKISGENLSEFINAPLFELGIISKNFALSLRNFLEIFMLKISSLSLPHVSGGKVGVMGILESRGLSPKGVIIVDFNDDLVPKRTTGEMFLNSTIRKRAGLISYQDRENLQRSYYKNLIDAALFVAISYQNSEDKLPSRFLKYFNTKSDESYLDSDYLGLFHGGFREFVPNYDDEIICKHDFFANELSFSRLNSFLTCPRKYYYKYILSIKEPTAIAQNSASSGMIFHASLDELYRNLGHFDLGEFIKIYTKNAAKNLDEFEIKLNSAKFAKLGEILIEHEKNWSFYESEKSINGVKFAGILIGGKIDRIDRNEEGEICIIDYKSGKADKKSLQLPFYKALIADDSARSLYLSLKNLEFVEQEAGLDESLLAQIEAIKAINKTEINFAPSKNGCEYCAYITICKGKNG